MARLDNIVSKLLKNRYYAIALLSGPIWYLLLLIPNLTREVLLGNETTFPIYSPLLHIGMLSLAGIIVAFINKIWIASVTSRRVQLAISIPITFLGTLLYGLFYSVARTTIFFVEEGLPQGFGPIDGAFAMIVSFGIIIVYGLVAAASCYFLVSYIIIPVGIIFQLALIWALRDQLSGAHAS